MSLLRSVNVARRDDTKRYRTGVGTRAQYSPVQNLRASVLTATGWLRKEREAA